MDRARETYSGEKNCVKGFSGPSELKTVLENVGVDGKDNSKMDLK